MEGLKFTFSVHFLGKGVNVKASVFRVIAIDVHVEFGLCVHLKLTAWATVDNVALVVKASEMPLDGTPGLQDFLADEAKVAVGALCNVVCHHLLQVSLIGII